MIINKIRTLQLKAFPRVLWVELQTDTGLVGLGETMPKPGASRVMLHETLSSFLLGQDPLQIEWIWNNIFRAINTHGWAGTEIRTLSAIDIALWDIFGQYTNQPIYQLLGGKVRDNIKVYNTCAGADQAVWLKDAGRLAQELLADGVDVMKLWPFDVFSRPPYLGHYLTPEDIDTGLDTIRQIKGAVGERMRIAVDGHGRYHLPTAKMLARALQPFDILWYEDMTMNENAPALRELKEASGSISLAVSERLFTRRQMRDVLERQACDLVIADPSWMGGITETRKLANMAETYELPFAPHNCGGPVLHLVCTALSAHLPNLWLMETVRSFYNGWFKEVITGLPEIRDGFSALPEGPGLGARLRPEVWQREDATVDVTELGQKRDPEALVYIQSGYGIPWRH